MQKNTWQKIKDLFDYPGTLGIGLTLLEIFILVVIYCFNRQGNTMQSQTKTSSSYGSESYSAQSYNSSSNNSNQNDDSSTKWKEFAGTTYRASQFTSEGYQYYAFSYNRSGKGKYFIYFNYPGTNVVEDKNGVLNIQGRI